jgi:hypothetical protein
MIGEIGIIEADHRWEVETVRYMCENGHMIFITGQGNHLIHAEVEDAISWGEEV